MPIGFFPKGNFDNRIAVGGPGRRVKRGYQPEPFKKKRPYKAPPPEPEAQIQLKPEPPKLPPARLESFKEIEVLPKFEEALAALTPISIITPSVKTDIFDIVLLRERTPKTIEIIIESPPLEILEEVPLEALTSDFPSSFEEPKQEVAPLEIILPTDIEEDDIPFIVALAEDELELAALFASGV